jgi:hypothetical protein
MSVAIAIRMPGAVVFQQPGREQRGEERSEVDREVEPAEHPLEEVAVRPAELISHVCRHAGLDAPRADRHQRQAGDQPAAGLERGREEGLGHVHQRQAEVAHAVDDREQEDRQVFAEEGVGHDSADDREEVGAGDEQMHPLPRLRLGHEVGPARARQQVLRHEHDQDRLHPVERKPLGGLIPDDVGNARGHAAGGGGLRAIAVGVRGHETPLVRSRKMATASLTTPR